MSSCGGVLVYVCASVKGLREGGVVECVGIREIPLKGHNTQHGSHMGQKNSN